MKKPTWLEPIFNNIPDRLKEQPWGVWRAEPRLDNDLNPTGKFNKAPRNPTTGIKVGANKPELFGTFEEAKQAYEAGGYTGVGVLLTGNGIIGIDIDDAKKLFKDRPEIKEWLEKAINEGVYCEQSPSAKGFRLFAQGELPNDCQKKKGGLEIYDDHRFLTVTGHVIGEESND
ncbi:hypothetical protein G6695_06765 [Polynucleobacter paneuropaeus]|nr:hypothetical protein [Polynucleobacter paneuropaeus]